MHNHIYGPVELIATGVALTGVVPTNEILTGELVALAGGVAVPADAFTWNTDIATTQTNFAAALLGVSADNSLAASDNALSVEISVHTDGTFDADLLAAATVEIGNYLAPAKNPSSNSLVNELVVVATKARATHVVQQRETVATTKVKARLINTPHKR